MHMHTYTYTHAHTHTLVCLIGDWSLPCSVLYLRLPSGVHYLESYAGIYRGALSNALCHGLLLFLPCKRDPAPLLSHVFPHTNGGVVLSEGTLICISRQLTGSIFLSGSYCECLLQQPSGAECHRTQEQVRSSTLDPLTLNFVVYWTPQ